MEVKVFSLPALKDENYCKISACVNELHKRYKEHQPLDEIEIDWLDTANNWLLEH